MTSFSREAQVYSYSRFSLMRQKDGDSLRRQAQYAEQVAEEYSLTINEDLVFSDHGKSAFHAKHKKNGMYGVFLEAVRNGKVAKGSVLIVESFDRLSREHAMRAQVDIANLIESGITIITSSDKQVYNKESVYQNPGQIFMMSGIMMRAHNESLEKQKRSLKKISGAVEKWKSGDKTVSVGGAIPSWVKRTKRGLTIIDDTAEVVKEICKMFIDGKSMNYIAGFLTDRGVDTFGQSSHWRVTTITKILENEALFGRKTIDLGASEDGSIPPYFAVLDGYFPPLISEKEYDLIQEIKKLKTNGRTGYKVEKTIVNEDGNITKEVERNSVYMLSSYGLAKGGSAKCRCSKCGGSMGVRRQKQYTRSGEYTKTEYRLVCNDSGTTSNKKCDVGSVKIGNMETFFLLAVSSHIDFNLLNKNADSREVEVIESKLKEIELETQNVMHLYAKSTTSARRQYAQEMLDKLAKEEEELQRKREDGKEIIIKQDAIDRFTSIIDRAAFNMEDHDARSEVKNILMQSVTKLVMHIKKKQTMADFGFPNIMPGVVVYGIEVHFKSEKVLWCFHDVVRDEFVFTAILNSDETSESLSESDLKKWNSMGDEAYEDYVAIQRIEKMQTDDEFQAWIDELDETGVTTSTSTIADLDEEELTKAEQIREKWSEWEDDVSMTSNYKSWKR